MKTLVWIACGAWAVAGLLTIWQFVNQYLGFIYGASKVIGN